MEYARFSLFSSNFILYSAIFHTSYYQQNPIAKPNQKNKQKERTIMANTNNGSNQGMVPEARAAMNRFKMEAAADFAVPTPS